MRVERDTYQALIRYIEHEILAGRRHTLLDSSVVHTFLNQKLSLPSSPHAAPLSTVSATPASVPRAATVPAPTHPSHFPPSPPPETTPHHTSLAALQNAVHQCELCALRHLHTSPIFGIGCTTAPQVLFVSGAPSLEDAQKGQPFTDEAGELLSKMIAAMGLSRDAIYLTNLLKCHPDQRKVPSEPIQACLAWLKNQIHLMNPQKIIALGDLAYQTLSGKPTGKIQNAHGVWFAFEGYEVLPTFHPKDLLNNREAKKLAWSDLQRVMKALHLTSPAQK